MNRWLVILSESIFLLFLISTMERIMRKNSLIKANKKTTNLQDSEKKTLLKNELQTVILDGNILKEGLTNAGLNETWLISQLELKGISIDNVFIGQVDFLGMLFLDLFEDNIELPKSHLKELIYENLKKSEEDLISVALETKNEKTKAVYIKDAEKLKLVMNKLEPYLIS
jgi:hypothetical protein